MTVDGERNDPFRAGMPCAKFAGPVLAFAALVLALVSGRSHAAELDSEIEKIVHPFLQSREHVAVAIGIVDGDTSRAVGFGRLSHSDDRPPDGDTLFEIGSVTKVFTALLLADMANAGRVRFDDPVRRYLPSSVTVPARGGRDITLLDLATHRSGLPRMPSNFMLSEHQSRHNPYRHYTADLLYDFLSSHKLGREIGSRFEYSNLGFGLLGHALARRAGMDYEDLVIERICDPLGMRDTRITLAPGQKRRLAPPHTADGRRTQHWQFDVLAGAGALRSSVNDLMIFLAANMGLRRTALFPAMETCHTVRGPTGDARHRIALGWHVFTPDDGPGEILWHNGGTGGYHSYLGFIKETRTGVVVLTNCVDSIDEHGVKILRLLAGVPKRSGP